MLFDLAQILASFIARETPVPMLLDDARYPHDPAKEIWAFATAASAQDFVLAHELGHVALGHLQATGAQRARRLRSGVEVYSKSQQQEFAADLFAARLLFELEPVSDEQRVLDLLYGKYMGVGVFFDLDSLVTEIERRTFALPEAAEGQSHPPARSREANVLRALRNASVDPNLFADRRALGRTVKRFREAIIEETVSLIVNYDWD